ncbi:MAG: mycothiol system anti-sigma-R factor [Acidimicrobiia bacterium]
MGVDCKELVENLYLLLDEELGEDRCAELKAHLDRCHDCTGRFGLEREFKELVQRKCGEQAPSELLDRIRTKLEGAR